MLSDVFTPVSIYLRLRDQFRDTILLESSDHHVAENSFSFIAINAVAGIEISTSKKLEYKLPGEKPEQKSITNATVVADEVWNFMQIFQPQSMGHKMEGLAQQFFGYTSFDAVQFFDQFNSVQLNCSDEIPLMRYRLYQYVIAIDHHKDELYLLENKIPGLTSEIEKVEALIRSKDVPVFPFETVGSETVSHTDDIFKENVQKGIDACLRGDVFQLVLSRRFQQAFKGDEFNVYRTLRSINPSPYLFFFDYGNYKLLGSSPESQLIIQNGKAIVHPIAGTFKRTGNDDVDKAAAEQLLKDAKENAEHVMLVDLARNDLSRVCTEVQVAHYKQIQYYSHVIHLVSEVVGKLPENTNPFLLLAKSFPAGTLSGAPKIKAIELIGAIEKQPRSYYGGAIGAVGLNGNFNHAIMIRTILSKLNTLVYQVGAGVVAASNPDSELQELNNKIGALRKAIEEAKGIKA